MNWHKSPLLELYCLFHIDSLLRNLFSIALHIAIDMKGAPKGKPTQVDKTLPALRPNSITNSSTLTTSPIRISSHFSRFIFSPELQTIWAVNLKWNIWSWESSHKSKVSSTNKRCNTKLVCDCLIKQLVCVGEISLKKWNIGHDQQEILSGNLVNWVSPMALNFSAP